MVCATRLRLSTNRRPWVVAIVPQDHKISIISRGSSSRTHPVQPMPLAGILGGFGPCVPELMVDSWQFTSWETGCLRISWCETCPGGDHWHLAMEAPTNLLLLSSACLLLAGLVAFLVFSLKLMQRKATLDPRLLIITFIGLIIPGRYISVIFHPLSPLCL